MTNYDSILTAANELPAPDRMRLIDALWDTVPDETEAPFSDEWLAEIERRVADVQRGRDVTVPWSQVREEAFARLQHGQDH